jgi:hypothetical protein
MGTESNSNSNFPRDPGTDSVVDDTDLDALVDAATGGDESSEAIASEADAADRAAGLLPVHAAPTVGGKSKGGTVYKIDRQKGRPRRVERMPTTSDLEYHAKIIEEKAKFIDADAVVQAAVKHADPMAMLAVIRTEVAKESAALHFQRIENEKFGKDTAQVSTRRIDALKKIADIELEIKKLGGDVVDVHSEKMVRIFQFFIETVKGILAENLSEEQIDLVFNRLSTEFEGWQEKLSEALR